MYNYTEYTKKNIFIQEVISLALKFVGGVCHDLSVPRTRTESEDGVTFQCLYQ